MGINVDFEKSDEVSNEKIKLESELQNLIDQGNKIAPEVLNQLRFIQMHNYPESDIYDELVNTVIPAEADKLKGQPETETIDSDLENNKIELKNILKKFLSKE
ncbi:MAG: hypothetical protein WC621_05270 [Patescibacteria group bacterium]